MGSGTFFDSSRNCRCFYVWILLPVCCFSKLHNSGYYRKVFILRLRKLPCFKRSERRQRCCYGILLAYTLPPSVPWYIPVVGSFFAVAIAKHAFGGLGNNIWNPALAARAFLQVAYPAVINSDWRTLTQHGIHKLVHNITQVDAEGKLVDAITRATPLAKEAGAETYHLAQLLMGNIPGCIGETSAIALLLGGMYLIYKRHIKWYVPAYYIATVFVMVLILPPQVATPWIKNPFTIFLQGAIPGCIFYGYRYGYLSSNKTGSNHLCYWLWYFNGTDSFLFWLSGRCMLFHIAHEHSNASH